MVLIKDITSKIKDILNKNPQGMTITQIAQKTRINRNTVGRYLENLLVSGQVEMHRFGMKKIYALSQRVALSSILSISSELVVQMDSSLRIIYANEPFLKLVETDNTDILGKNIEYTPVSLVFDELFTGFIENIKEGVIGKEWSGEFVLSTKDIHLFCRIVPTVFDDGRKGVSVILEDITSQKKAEDARKESEEQYQSLIETTGTGYVILDKEGRVITANREYLRLTGRSNLAEIKGRSVIDWTASHDFERNAQEIEQIYRKGYVRNLEIDYQKPDGTIQPIEINASVIQSGSEQIILTLCRDITERRHTEYALRESEEKYRTLIDRANDGICVIQDSVIKMCNARLTEFWGGPVEELLGKSFRDFIHPDALSDIVDRYNRRMAGENLPPVYETILKRRDGSRFHAELNAGLVSYEGRPANLIIIRDINDRKKAEGVLRESEERYRTLTEASHDLIFVIGRDDRVEYVNSFAAAMLNKPVEQVVGSSRTSFFPPDMAAYQKRELEKVFETGIPVRSEDPLPLGDRVYWFDHLLTPLKDPEGKVRSVLGISRDITKRKNAEAQAQNSEQRFQRLLELTFDAIAIHKDKKITFLNEKAAKILGAASPQDLIGRSMLDFVHPDSRSDIEDRVRKISTDPGAQVPLIPEKFLRLDGSTVSVEVMAISFLDNGLPAVQVAFREIATRETK